MTDKVMTYTKKPVKVQAIKWTGENLKDVIDFIGLHESANKWSWEEYEEVVRTQGLKIFTLEGTMMASIGDFIIRGVNGEFYPCKPDIFEKTYDINYPEDIFTLPYISLEVLSGQKLRFENKKIRFKESGKVEDVRMIDFNGKMGVFIEEQALIWLYDPDEFEYV